MDISNLKEENLHLEAKILLKELRSFYVETGGEIGLLVRMHGHRNFIEKHGALGCDHHKTRAYQIAMAELQMAKLIKGVG